MTDHNDWRVTISVVDPAQVHRAKQAISDSQVDQDVHRRLGRAIAVGAGDSRIFLYAGTEVAAWEAERVARDVLATHGIGAGFALHRWHPIEERWEDPRVAMPQTGAQRQAEHQRLLADETTESLTTGIAQWEARIEFRSHHEAAEMAARLRADGRTVLRRWRFLVVGANNEDDAQALARQLRQEAPPDATVRAEHSGVFLPFIPFLSAPHRSAGRCAGAPAGAPRGSSSVVAAETATRAAFTPIATTIADTKVPVPGAAPRAL